MCISQVFYKGFALLIAETSRNYLCYILLYDLVMSFATLIIYNVELFIMLNFTFNFQHQCKFVMHGPTK